MTLGTLSSAPIPAMVNGDPLLAPLPPSQIYANPLYSALPVTSDPGCVVGATDPATGETIAGCGPVTSNPNTSCPTGYTYDNGIFQCVPVTGTWIPGVSNTVTLGIGAVVALFLFMGRGK